MIVDETVPEIAEETPIAEVQETEQAPQPAEDEVKETDESKRLRGVERRINRLASERAAARAEAEFYRKQLESVAPKNEEDSVPLTRAQMEAEFEAWEQNRREGEKRERVAEKLSKAIDSDKEFAQALNAIDIEFQPEQLAVFADMIEESDSGIALMKYLAKNPDDVETLVGLSPLKLARELTRLEIKAVQAAKPKVSRADAPIEPVKGSASLSTLGDPDKIGVEAWIKKRNEMLRKK